MAYDPTGVVSIKRTLSYASGWAGEIVYCILVDQVDNHIAAHQMDFFPGTDNIQVVQIIDEPWMDKDVVRPGVPGTDVMYFADRTRNPNYNPATPAWGGYNNFRKLTYQFAPVYLPELVPWPTQFPQPKHTAGTTLKLATKFSGQYLVLPGAAIGAVDLRSSIVSGGGSISNPNYGKPLPSESPARQSTILIPLMDFIVEWGRVQNLAGLDFSDRVGKVNSVKFLGSEPGTLLCEGAELEPSFVIGYAPHAWQARVTYKRRRIVSGDSIYGWNHEYRARANPPGWYDSQMGNGKPPYPTYDFTNDFWA